jgi:hypothetical protein
MLTNFIRKFVKSAVSPLDSLNLNNFCERQQAIALIIHYLAAVAEAEKSFILSIESSERPGDMDNCAESECIFELISDAIDVLSGAY